MTTCWFCKKRPEDPRSAWTTALHWTRPRSVPPPVTFDETVQPTPDIRKIKVRVPRCARCRRRARLPMVANAIGIAAGAGCCVVAVAVWAKLSAQGLPRIGGTWYPAAAAGAVAGGLLGLLAAQPWHPKPFRHSWFEYPSLRLLAAEGWTASRRD